MPVAKMALEGQPDSPFSGHSGPLGSVPRLICTGPAQRDEAVTHPYRAAPGCYLQNPPLPLKGATTNMEQSA